MENNNISYRQVAIDDGFGYIKYLDNNGRKNKFPAVIKPILKSKVFRNVMGNAHDDYEIKFRESNGEEQELFIGDSALINGGKRDLESKGSVNENKLKYTIATCFALLDIKQNEKVDLVVGLPLSYFIETKEKVKAMLENFTGEVELDGKRTKISFNSIMVQPQGSGAYYAECFDKHGTIKDLELATKSVGVIEIGYKTVEYLIMKRGKKGVTMVGSKSGSLDNEGMYKVYEYVTDKLNTELKNKTTDIQISAVEEAIEWFNKEIDYNGSTIDLTPYVEEAYKERARAITAQIKAKWESEEAMLYKLFIGGGGAKPLFSYLKEKFIMAEIQKDPAFKNCEGFLAIQSAYMNAKQSNK